jgi:hypothetical protein
MKHVQTGDRLIALFLLGVLFLSPPLLAVFRVDTIIAGVPLLYLYLFAVWALLIVLLALAIELGRRREAAQGTPQDSLPPDD